MRTLWQEAIQATQAEGRLTPDFVDWVWRIGIRHVTTHSWLFRVDWEGVIQDVLAFFLKAAEGLRVELREGAPCLVAGPRACPRQERPYFSRA
jgi:hypothetical protein